MAYYKRYVFNKRERFNTVEFWSKIFLKTMVLKAVNLKAAALGVYLRGAF